MVNTAQLVLVILAGRTSAWTPQGAVLEVPQEVDLEERLKADPNNCNVYYYLKTPLTCGEGNAFNKATLRCDSLENVAKSDPSCGGEGGSGGSGGGGEFGGSGGAESVGARNGGSGSGGRDVSNRGGGGSGDSNSFNSRGSSQGGDRSGITGDYAGKGELPQSRYEGGRFGNGGYQEASNGDEEGADSSNSEYGNEESSDINGYPSQGRNEDFELSQSEYVGNIRKRAAQESSFPTYASSSRNELEKESGDEGVENKGYQSGSNNDQLGAYKSDSSLGTSSVSDSDDSSDTGYEDEGTSGKEDAIENTSFGGPSEYADKANVAEDNIEPGSYKDAENAEYGQETAGSLSEGPDNTPKEASSGSQDGGIDAEYSDELSGYKSDEENGPGGIEKTLAGYEKDTVKKSIRGSRRSKNDKVDRKSKEIGSGHTGKDEEEAGDVLESNAWETRRVKQGWAAFRALIGNPTD